MRRALLAVFATIAGLTAILSYKTPTAQPELGMSEAAMDETVVEEPVTDTSTTTTIEPATTTTTAPAPATPATTEAPKPTTTTPVPKRTITGPAAKTEYGPIQVQVQVQGTKILSVKTVVYPQTSPTSATLNKKTVTKLETQAMAAQSADIDVISGATETSVGFLDSLKGALSKR